MKTRTCSALVLLAVLSTTSAVSLFANDPAPQTIPVSAVLRDGFPSLEIGATATNVVAILDRPDQKLSGDTWVYRRFKVKGDKVPADGCTTVLDTLSHGRVSHLYRVNAPALQAIAVKFSAPAAPGQLLAGQ